MRIWVVFFLVFVNLIGFGVVQPIFPLWADRLGAPAELITMTIGAYSLGQFLTAPIWGRLSDAFGRRPILLFSLVGSVLSYVLLGLADSVWFLFAARTIGGIFAGNLSASSAYMADITTGEERARGMGLLGAGFGLGLIFGPAIGGFVAGGDLASANFMTVALVAGSMSLLSLIGTYFLLPESLAPDNRKPLQGRLIQMKAPNLNVLQGRTTLLLLIATTVLTFSALTLMTSVLPLWASRTLDYSPREVGYIFTYVGTISAFVQMVAIGRLSKIFGDENLVSFGILTLGLGLTLLCFVDNSVFLVVALTLMSFGSACMSPALTSLVSKEADESERGVVLGIYQSSHSLGRVIWSHVIGRLFCSDKCNRALLDCGLGAHSRICDRAAGQAAETGRRMRPTQPESHHPGVMRSR